MVMISGKIIAVDFDNTLTKPSQYPITGELQHEVIQELILIQSFGNKIILWTCREGEELQEAIDLCGECGLVFDAVNENIDDHHSRKVFADVYLDDKNMSIQTLSTILRRW